MKYEDFIEIFVITYNRANYLKRTLDNITNSPLKDCLITVLDNNSIDNTSDICSQYKNVKYIKNNKNCSGDVNICKAFELCGNRKYVWVFCDDDNYNFSKLNQIDEAIANDSDCIIVNKKWLPEKYNHGQFLKQFSFVPACILKTDLITDDIITTMYCSAQWFLPHFAIGCKIINENKKVHVVKEEIIYHGTDNDKIGCYMRGISETHPYRRDMFWFCGFVNSIQNIKDLVLKYKIVEQFFDDKLLNGLIFQLRLNKFYYNNSLKNVLDIFAGMSNKQRLNLLVAFISTHKYFDKYFVQQNVSFDKYLEKKNVKRELNNLSKKYKNKKVVIYGAGTFAQNIFKNSLGKLNVVAIADNRFAIGSETSFMVENNGRYIGINPLDINKYEHDVILIAIYREDKIIEYLESINVKSEAVPIIKKSFLEKKLSSDWF